MNDNLPVLTAVTELPACIERWTGRSLPRRVMAHWLVQGAAATDPQPLWLTDNPADPRVVMRLQGTVCTVHGSAESVARALRDLHAGQLDAAAPWPGPREHAEWDRAGRRELSLSRVLGSTLRAAYAAGFQPVPEAAQPYYCAHAWYILGTPRFAGQVVHPVRVVHGEELLELLLEDNGRDEVDYLRACLNAGPSFVVEIDGVPVSWGCTHLGGAVGRLYTRPEHRGHGYGKSLTALHVDTTLGRAGIAVASVRVDNAASYRMFQALEGRHIRGPLTWSRLVW